LADVAALGTAFRALSASTPSALLLPEPLATLGLFPHTDRSDRE